MPCYNMGVEQAESLDEILASLGLVLKWRNHHLQALFACQRESRMVTVSRQPDVTAYQNVSVQIVLYFAF